MGDAGHTFYCKMRNPAPYVSLQASRPRPV